MARRASYTGLTLLEVVLAISLSIIILGSALGFYSQAMKHRRIVTAEVNVLTSERQAMERFTEDIRGVLAYPFISMGIKGETDSIEFLSTTIPGPAVWAELSATDNPPPPEHDLHLIKYQLATADDPETGERTIVGLERIVRKIIVAHVMIDQEEDMFGNEIDMESESEQIDPADASITLMLVSRDIKHLAFRYWLDGDWVETYDDSRVPSAVEVTFGLKPLEEGLLSEDYIHEVYRRVVYIPTSGGSNARISGQRDNADSGDEP